MNASAPALSPVVERVLRDHRSEINARFAQLAPSFPRLHGEDALDFFRGPFAMVVDAVAAIDVEAVDGIFEAASQVGLEAVGRGLVGPRVAEPYMGQLWFYVFPALARHLVLDANRVLRSLSNAVLEVRRHAGVRTGDFLAALASLGPRTHDVDELLRLGQVLAWRNGLAHYATGARDALDSIDRGLAMEAMRGASGMTWEAMRARLHESRWNDPSYRTRSVQPGWEGGFDEAGERLFGVIHRIGGFTGFGGPFREPPRIGTFDGDLIVMTRERQWVVTADAFGAVLHPANNRPEPALAVADGRTTYVTPDAIGDSQVRIDLGARGPITGLVRLDEVSAVTFTNSHEVWIVALPSQLHDRERT